MEPYSTAPLPSAQQPSCPAMPPTPPRSPDSTKGLLTQTELHGHPNGSSQASINTFQSSQSRKEYMDKLVVPPTDEIRRIAEVQTEREAEHRRQSREAVRASLDLARSAQESQPPAEAKRSHHKLPLSPRHWLRHEPNEEERSKAATTIQRAYRGYRVRREVAGLGLDASTRWTHALRDAQWREITRPRARTETIEAGESIRSSVDGRPEGSSGARQKWRKAAIIARHAGLDVDDDEDDSSSLSSASSSSSGSAERSAAQRKEARRKRAEEKAKRKKGAQTMGLPYFLEMVDVKHRYGSNLRTYHEEWKKADTNENFFYWLDYGEGRYLDMEGCPRERLDREQVRYLSREERQYYLVKVDEEGRLCWAKNGARIDTTEEWKDSVHGIVPADDPTPAFNPENAPRDADGDSATSSGTSESEREAARAAKYATPGFDQAHGIKKVKHVSAATIFDKLLRKSVKKNTWIFVADTNFRLYVGIKASGAFQHSSFLQGSRISAAGLIKIKNGRLSSLSPLSGHYRPPASNFRAFVHSLKEEGVDMSHVSISKSYAVLVGLEAYMKTRRKGKELVKKIAHRKDKILAPEEVRRREEEERDKSESAKKEREFLEKQRKEESEAREENRAGLHLMQKLKIVPQEPAGGPSSQQEETKEPAKEDKGELA